MGFFDFLKKKRTPQIPAEALMLWVHRKSHFDTLETLAAEREPILILPINDALSACIAAATTKGPMPVAAADLEALGLDGGDVIEQALRNMTPVVSSPDASDGLCRWSSTQESAGALVYAVPLVAGQLPIKGKPVFMHPEANLALVAGDEDLSALERMLELAVTSFDGSGEFRSLVPLHWIEGSPLPVPWEAPASHPLRDRVRALSARMRKLDAESLLYAYNETAPAKLAPLAYGPHGLTAAWMREANVLIPASCERVLLLDTPDSKHPRLEVDLAALRDVLGHALEDLGRSALAGEEAEGEEEQPTLFFRTRGSLFPSARELQYLAERKGRARIEQEVDPRELLREWDAGRPVLVLHEEGRLRLDAPDGRNAVVELDAIRSRIGALPAQDLLAFRCGLIGAALIAVVTGEGDADAAMADAMSVGNPGVTNEQLRERLSLERPQLISSLMSDALQEEAEENALTAHLLRTLDPVALYPVLRPPGYAAGKNANVLGMVAGFTKGEAVNVVEPKQVSRPFAEGVTLELVSDGGNMMMPLNADLLGPELEAPAWRTAMLNLAANSVQPLQELAPGIWAGPWHDDYDAARVLLLPELTSACAVKGERLIFAPTVGRTWVTGSEDVEGMRAVLDAVDAHLGSGEATTPYQFRQLLFGTPWVFRDGKPQRWNVPASHPLAARIAALEALLQKRRRSSTQHVGAFAQAVFTQADLRERSE